MANANSRGPEQGQQATKTEAVVSHEENRICVREAPTSLFKIFDRPVVYHPEARCPVALHIGRLGELQEGIYHAGITSGTSIESDITLKQIEKRLTGLASLSNFEKSTTPTGNSSRSEVRDKDSPHSSPSPGRIIKAVSGSLIREALANGPAISIRLIRPAGLPELGSGVGQPGSPLGS